MACCIIATTPTFTIIWNVNHCLPCWEIWKKLCDEDVLTGQQWRGQLKFLSFCELKIASHTSSLTDWKKKKNKIFGAFLHRKIFGGIWQTLCIFLLKNEPNFRSNFNFKLIPWQILPNWLILISGRCKWLETFLFYFFNWEWYLGRQKLA